MSIPAEILAVKRPLNSVVIAYGKDKNHFAVRQRVGCKYVNGRSVPVNGPTIGHIEHGTYIPLDPIEKVTKSKLDLRVWGSVEFANRMFEPILEEIREVFHEDDAFRITTMAILRTCFPGIKDYELKEAYDTSFLSLLYPKVGLSKNSVSTFIGNLGRNCSRILQFMSNRVKRVKAGEHLVIDGTLKSDESTVNTLSNFSRKAKTKGTRDICVIYAYSLETKEPICSEVFPGNMLDCTCYGRFIADNNIQKGIIVGDKGFPSGSAAGHFKANKDLHYLNPIHRNAKYISTFDLHNYQGQLAGHPEIQYCKKHVPKANKYLYAFRNSQTAYREETTWLNSCSNGGTYSDEEHKRKSKSFGTIVLESDLDLTPEEIYKVYAKRWEIELVMRYYKSALDFDETRVQNDYSVLGTEFIDFLASVLTMKMINRFDELDLLVKMPYGKIMSVLKRAQKVRISEKEEWQLVSLNPSQEEILVKLGLIVKEDGAQPQRRNRGRPKKVQ